MTHPPSFPPSVYENLRIYEDLLKRWQKKINLVGKNEHIWERHILNCLWLAPLVDHYVPPPLSLACIGSGAGFPGIVIAVALQRPVTLIESKKKKCLFLNEVKRVLSLDVDILCQRIEETEDSFDGVMARGLAPLENLLSLVKPLLKPEGKAFLQKGISLERETKEADRFFEYERKKITSSCESQGCVLLVSRIKERERGIDVKGI